MMFLKNRVLPLLCVFSLLVSLCTVPVYARSNDFPEGYRDSDTVLDWDALVMNPGSAVLQFICNCLHCTLDPSTAFWKAVDSRVITNQGEVDRATLDFICSQYNLFFNCSLEENPLFLGSYTPDDMINDILKKSFTVIFLDELTLNFVVKYDDVSGLMRIFEESTGLFVVSSLGTYPYVETSTNISQSGGSRWIPYDTFYKQVLNDQAVVNIVNYNVLSNVYSSFILEDIDCRMALVSEKYIGIVGENGDTIYADSSGRPYVCWADEARSVTSEDRVSTSGNELDSLGNVILGGLDFSGNITGVDLSGLTVTLPDGTIKLADSFVYDESTKTYYTNCSDFNNTYVTYNYSWTYHINYTSITYIGQTEEYDKYYEVYYELPDGRDSADLTKEELEQLSVSVDVVPYARSADDTSLRSLYHFDGDTRDSSYWNYCTEFIWNKGASITYMDAGVFNGALYLDETEHDFVIKLPSNIYSNDFTLQFRYYQSHTEAPVTDSYIQLGSNKLLQFNGAYFLDGSGTSFSQTPIGTWNEICLMRKDSAIYVYLNGVIIGTYSDGTPYGTDILFHFGNEQQTYKYFDELRVLNYAGYDIGNYTPTSVPFDTNLALVLPDSVRPVADEYWSISSSHENLLSAYDLDFFGDSFINSSCFVQHDDYMGFCTEVGASFVSANTYPYMNVILPFTSVLGDQNSFSLMAVINGYKSSYTVSRNRIIPGSGLFSLVSFYESAYNYILPQGTYTLSLVFDDGEVASCTFNTQFDLVSSGSYGTFVSSHGVSFGLGVYRWNTSSSDYSWFSYLRVYPESSAEYSSPIVYMELVEGDTTDLQAEKVSSVAGIDAEQFHTPTLAVRTDLDITSYQIGGVRPSIPAKGQVWAMVENERITSIQIYNGQAWEGVDGRIWTGQRWIPASSFNIVTLQDMYDIADATQDYEYIYSESGFWSWWQKSWNSFTERFFASGGTGGGASGGSGSSQLGSVDLDADDEISDPFDEDAKSLWQFIVLVVSGGKSVVGGVREMFSGVVSTIPAAMDDITGAFDSGGLAVGALDGTSKDPDSVIDTYSSNESEVLDPWRYR